MKRKYQIPEIEITKVFTTSSILTDQSEPEGGSWVGGNNANFDENEANTPEIGSTRGSLWDD